MTDIVTIPDVLPISPYPALGSTNFNNEAYAYATSVPPAVSRMREIAVACWTNATAAQERANSAAGSASAASGSASAAASSAGGAAGSASAAASSAGTAASAASTATAALTAMQVMYLGSKAVNSHPATDNMGNPLQAGALYTNTGTNAALNKRGWWWDGAAWQLAWGDITGVYMPTTGGKFTGHIEVPAGATGNQAPRASEVVSRKVTPAASGTNLDSLPLLNGVWTGQGFVNAPSTESVWWYVEQIAHEANYVTQTAWGLTDQTPKYFRNQIGGVWQAWRQIIDSANFIEKGVSSELAAGTGSYSVNPANASLHYVAINAACTFNLVAPRRIGEQLSLHVESKGAVRAITFSANVKSPVGAFPVYSAGQIVSMAFFCLRAGYWDLFRSEVRNP